MLWLFPPRCSSSSRPRVQGFRLSEPSLYMVPPSYRFHPAGVGSRWQYCCLEHAETGPPSLLRSLRAKTKLNWQCYSLGHDFIASTFLRKTRCQHSSPERLVWSLVNIVRSAFQPQARRLRVSYVMHLVTETFIQLSRLLRFADLVLQVGAADEKRSPATA